jgi:hypothetical protein
MKPDFLQLEAETAWAPIFLTIGSIDPIETKVRG